MHDMLKVLIYGKWSSFKDYWKWLKKEHGISYSASYQRKIQSDERPIPIEVLDYTYRGLGISSDYLVRLMLDFVELGKYRKSKKNTPE